MHSLAYRVSKTRGMLKAGLGLARFLPARNAFNRVAQRLLQNLARGVGTKDLERPNQGTQTKARLGKGYAGRTVSVSPCSVSVSTVFLAR